MKILMIRKSESFLSVESKNEWNKLSINIGQKYTGEYNRLTLNLETEWPPNDFCKHSIYLIVSKRVLDIVKNVNCEYEYFPILIRKQKESVEYFLLNILSVVDIIDLDRSKFELMGRFPIRFEKLVLKAVSNTPAIFIADKTMETFVFLSDSLIARVTKDGLSGATFIDAEEVPDFY